MHSRQKALVPEASAAQWRLMGLFEQLTLASGASFGSSSLGASSSSLGPVFVTSSALANMLKTLLNSSIGSGCDSCMQHAESEGRNQFYSMRGPR